MFPDSTTTPFVLKNSQPSKEVISVLKNTNTRRAQRNN